MGERVPRVERTLEMDATPSDAGDPFAPGATLGHFLVRRVIGEGGMGTVLEAFDPDLERTVAIKVVTRGAVLREAQAMARLSHPNVVAVHEVGEAADRVFLVMEHVVGRTFGEWCAGRGWRAIVDAIAQAGDGLAAAHRAGLVHRDVKPSNLLVDDAGRVRVSDFGIAIDDGDGAHDLAGTPRYMAPEQAAGGAIDARVDQYALAVCLRERLGGWEVGRLGGRRRVRQAIERAAAAEPDKRFAKIEDFVAELRKALAPPVTILIAGAALLVAIAIAAIVWPRAGAPAVGCGDDLIDGVWSAASRATIAKAFAATARPEAAATADTVGQAIDRYASAWKLGRVAVCHDSSDAHARRVACMDRRLGELRAQIDVWTAADGNAVDHAIDAAGGLPAIDACADARAPAPPASLAPLYARIDHAEARYRSRAPLDDASLVSDAEAAGDHAALAAALSVVGRSELDSGHAADAARDQSRAADEAAHAGDDRAMADALLAEAASLTAGGHADEALGVIEAADAQITRADLADLEEAVLRRRGEALHHAGRDADAIAPLAQAVTLAEARAERDPEARLSLASALGLEADAQIGLTHYDLARPLLARGLAIEEEAYGPSHPEVATSLHDLAVCEARLGDHDAAAKDYAHAEQILIAAYGPDHEDVGLVEQSLGTLAVLSGDDAGARPHYDRARQILEKALPPDAPELSQLYEAIAALARDQDRCADAIPDYQRAVAGLDHASIGGVSLATALTGLGVCLTEVTPSRAAEGRAPLERALSILEAAHVPLRDTVEVQAGLAECLATLKDKPDAVAHANAGLAAIDQDPDPQTAAMRSWFTDYLTKGKL